MLKLAARARDPYWLDLLPGVRIKVRPITVAAILLARTAAADVLRAGGEDAMVRAGVAFTRSLSEALSKDGIRVNAVAPGPIWTPLIPASFDPEHVAKHGTSVPMQRAGQPNEVAPCYVFLASEESSFATGATFAVDGGMTTL